MAKRNIDFIKHILEAHKEERAFRDAEWRSWLSDQRKEERVWLEKQHNKFTEYIERERETFIKAILHALEEHETKAYNRFKRMVDRIKEMEG